MLRKRTGGQGFTLLELLVVVIIIGILATVALPQFAGAIKKAKEAEARSTLGAMMGAQWMYFQEKSTFTSLLADLTVQPGASTNWKLNPDGAAVTTGFTTIKVDFTAGGDLTTGVEMKMEDKKDSTHTVAGQINSNGVRKLVP